MCYNDSVCKHRSYFDVRKYNTVAIYMIDYENVKTGGLNGISRLTAEDRVIIFYSENANRLTFDLHRRLMECPAKIEYREVSVGGHNALDFQLVTYLGYLIAQDPKGQYLIISYDRGFEYVVNFWRKDGLSIGLVPYLKDPSYALKKVTTGEPVYATKQEEVADEPMVEFISPNEEDAEEPVQQAVEELPAETVVFTEEAPVEEASVEEAPVKEAPVEEAPAPTVEEAPAEEPAVQPLAEEVPAAATPAEETPAVKAPAKKKPAKKKPAAKKPAEKQEAPKAAEKPAEPEKKAEEKKAEDKSSRPLPSVNELKAVLGDLVADDPEARFVRTALEKYKTKLGLNNALVKHFGNQRAGEIYQKVKPFVAQKKDR